MTLRPDGASRPFLRLKTAIEAAWGGFENSQERRHGTDRHLFGSRARSRSRHNQPEQLAVGRVGLDPQGKLTFPRAPSRPGLYRFEFDGAKGSQEYIGETDKLDRRFQFICSAFAAIQL